MSSQLWKILTVWKDASAKHATDVVVTWHFCWGKPAIWSRAIRKRRAKLSSLTVRVHFLLLSRRTLGSVSLQYMEFSAIPETHVLKSRDVYRRNADCFGTILNLYVPFLVTNIRCNNFKKKLLQFVFYRPTKYFAE